MLAYANIRLGFSLSVPDHVTPGSAAPLQSHVRLDSAMLIYGTTQPGFSLPALDHIQSGLSLSSRGPVRFGFLMLVYGLGQPDLLLPILDCESGIVNASENFRAARVHAACVWCCKA